MLAFITRNCIELIPYEKEVKLLNGRWLFSIKEDRKGKVQRFKARYVLDRSRIQDTHYLLVITHNILGGVPFT